MTASFPRTLLGSLTLAALTAATAFGDSGIHLCNPDLCNGTDVISHAQPPGKKVLGFHVSLDGRRVIYVSNSSCRRELYSVSARGGPVIQLSDMATNVQDPCFRNVTDEFSISPDGRYAIWEADRDATSAPAQGDQDYELFSTPILGGATVQLNPSLPFDYDVEHHLVSCDSQRVIYRQGKDSSNRWELWSAPIRGPETAARRISQTMGMSQAVGPFDVRCDASVLFWADLATGGIYLPFLTTVTGGALLQGLLEDGFESGGTGAWR